MVDTLWAELAPKQSAVEAGLKQWLGRVAAAAPSAPAGLAEAMDYGVFTPGKRLRPLLAILACEAVGGSIAEAMPAGCAVEFVHTYSLIHDDLPAMDDDDLRRGLLTCHKKYGEALAILSGDALLTGAFEVLATGYLPPTAAVCCVELARAAGARGMVGGQVLDLSADGKIGSVARAIVESRESLEDIHRRKTGALFRAAVRMGILATRGPNPPANELKAVDVYASAFGLAFQVTDDLLDVAGSVTTVGKRVRKDAARGKMTYPGLLGVEESRRLAARLAAEAEAAVETFGSAGQWLGALARFVVTRDR
ncbi:MAG TPA: farnesyl diphosphate synthase [Fimbriiglobus sp.]|jgi:geranylgeranyl diphosphate synthase type II